MDFEEEIPGLPRDEGALLFGYKDSWAREIYETKYHSDAIRQLKPTAAPSKVLKDWPLSGECERFKRTTDNSGLSSAAENSMLDHDRVTISAFVESLYPENDTFNMPFGEMTITPDDAKQILNLNDHGVAVKYEYTKKLSWEHLYDLCKNCFGWDKETTYIEFNKCFSYKTRQFNMIQLIKMFKGTIENEHQGTLSDAEVDVAATAYLLAVLGCVIFPNTSGNRVDAKLLQLLHPPNKVVDYSWGTTTIVFFMAELRKASRLRTSQIAGNVSLFQTWIHDHYPSLKLEDVNTTWERCTPRGTKYKFTKNRSRAKEQQLVSLREKLDLLKASEVCFDPYKEDRASGHIAGRSELSYYFGPLWHPTCYVMYNGSRVMRKYGSFQTVPWHHINGKFKLDVEHIESNQDNIKVVYSGTPSVTEHWDKRQYHLVNAGRAVNRGDENALYGVVNKFNFLSKWCIDYITDGQLVPIEKIKKHMEMIDNVDNEEYAAEFGRK
ncbi:protein MAIN-LIKE 1-like [Papaver somniferum]|uniref:protein MAIN-LIKE 1-like n=1 Tax=Papaver somniferum TaxID=3469 RepID=UPI000E70265B|nr:protein MAIN-LIKE 1-like [Papaver somniferum]